MCRTHVSDTCVGHMFSLDVFSGYMYRTHVSDTCMLKMFSQDTEMFPLDTCVRHMCRTHVSDTCVLVCSGLYLKRIKSVALAVHHVCFLAVCVSMYPWGMFLS